MTNVFMIHSYNGNTRDSFAPSIQKLCENQGIDYYFPSFPIRDEATYDGWEDILNSYKEKGLLNQDSIVIAHSLGTQFFPKYLARNPIKIKIYISVAGFVNYKGRQDLENISKHFQPTEADYKNFKELVNNRYAIYSDNDKHNSIDKLEKYADLLAAHKILIKGAGHFTLSSGITQIEEIEKIILENIKP